MSPETAITIVIQLVMFIGFMAFIHAIYQAVRSVPRWNFDERRELARANYMRCMTLTAQMECEVWGRVMSGSVEAWLKERNITISAKKPEEEPETKRFAPGKVIEVPEGETYEVVGDDVMARALEGMGLHETMSMPTRAELKELQLKADRFMALQGRGDFLMQYNGWFVEVRAGVMVEVRRQT